MDGCPKTDVERILEFQRRMFEAKLKQLQQPTTTQTKQTSSGLPPTVQQPTTQQSAISSSSRNTNNQSQIKSRPVHNPSNFKPPNYKAKSEMNLSRLPMPKKPKPKEKGNNLIVETFRRRDDEVSSSAKKQPHRRNRSVSRSHTKPERNQDEGYNCPTCKKHFGVYIYQCSNGHSSCKECKLKSANCGLCSKPITETRNIALESFLAERIVACPNTVDGCWLFFKLVDMEAHLKECPFSELACPVDTCSWRGKLPKLSPHFDDTHPENRQSTAARADTELLINIKSNKTTMHLVETGPYNFIIRVKFDEKASKVYMVAKLYGTCVSASKWSYKFQISNGTQMYEYSDVCLPHFVAAEDIYKDAKCAVLPIDFAMNFVKEDCLAYKFSLKKDIPAWKHGATSWKNKSKYNYD